MPRLDHVRLESPRARANFTISKWLEHVRTWMKLPESWVNFEHIRTWGIPLNHRKAMKFTSINFEGFPMVFFRPTQFQSTHLWGCSICSSSSKWVYMLDRYLDRKTYIYIYHAYTLDPPNTTQNNVKVLKLWGETGETPKKKEGYKRRV